MPYGRRRRELVTILLRAVPSELTMPRGCLTVLANSASQADSGRIGGGAQASSYVAWRSQAPGKGAAAGYPTLRNASEYTSGARASYSQVP